MASSLIWVVAFGGADFLRDAVLRGELAFFVAGFVAWSFSAVSSADDFELSFVFLGMTKTGIAVLARIGLASRFRKGLA